MKNKPALLFCIFSLIATLPAYSQADSLSVQPLIVQDSSTTSYEWTTRSPLSPELQQQRADNRAEVESMKRRFRAFHQQTSVQEKNTEEEQDFLWSEAEGSINNNAPIEKNNVSTTNTEEMRMQINRSFQQEAMPTTPDLPSDNPSENYNFDTDNTVTPKGNQVISIETGWEDDAFQSNNTVKVDWQLNLDQNKKNAVPARQLTKGEVINMALDFENRSSVLNPAIKMRLNEWIALFSAYPGIKIEVRAHTHQGISYTEALELTTQRARAIIDYFSASGIPSQQLNFKGYGNLSPLFSSSDGHNQEKNERIELIILELPKR